MWATCMWLPCSWHRDCSRVLTWISTALVVRAVPNALQYLNLEKELRRISEENVDTPVEL